MRPKGIALQLEIHRYVAVGEQHLVWDIHQVARYLGTSPELRLSLLHQGRTQLAVPAGKQATAYSSAASAAHCTPTTGVRAHGSRTAIYRY